MSDYTRSRWEKIKAMAPTSGLMWDSSRNGTRDVGRNKAKREKRAAKH